MLAEVTPELARHCFAVSVNSARYWQKPDGEDIVASSDQVREGLRRVAEYLSGSAETAWWWAPVDRQAQWAVQWDDPNYPQSTADPLKVLKEARRQYLREEEQARRERSKKPAAQCSGNWGSRPSEEILYSTRELCDGSPAGLYLVEDDMGWEAAETQHLVVPPEPPSLSRPIPPVSSLAGARMKPTGSPHGSPIPASP